MDDKQTSLTVGELAAIFPVYSLIGFYLTLRMKAAYFEFFDIPRDLVQVSIHDLHRLIAAALFVYVPTNLYFMTLPKNDRLLLRQHFYFFFLLFMITIGLMKDWGYDMWLIVLAFSVIGLWYHFWIPGGWRDPRPYEEKWLEYETKQDSHKGIVDTLSTAVGFRIFGLIILPVLYSILIAAPMAEGYGFRVAKAESSFALIERKKDVCAVIAFRADDLICAVADPKTRRLKREFEIRPIAGNEAMTLRKLGPLIRWWQGQRDLLHSL